MANYTVTSDYHSNVFGFTSYDQALEHFNHCMVMMQVEPREAAEENMCMMHGSDDQLIMQAIRQVPLDAELVVTE